MARPARSFLSRSRSRSHNKNQIKEKSRTPSPEKELPDFEPSGILNHFSSNQLQGIALKFTEPHDAEVPDQNYRIYVFKGEEHLALHELRQKSVFLIGKKKEICDFYLEHPTISSQHAVIQFRKQHIRVQDGTFRQIVKPYLMDLERQRNNSSTNGTFLNKEQLEPARYYELQHQDTINFAQSTRDYVLLKVEDYEDE